MKDIASDLTSNTTPATTPDLVLDISGLQVAYGGIQAVKGIDLQIRKGELVTLIGANGAGRPPRSMPLPVR